MDTPLSRLTPTPSETTLSGSEADPPPSMPQVNVNSQADHEDSVLDAGSQPSITISKDNVAAAVAPISSLEDTSASGSGNSASVRSLTGKRKERMEEEGSETEKESEGPDTNAGARGDIDANEPLPLAKKRRLGSDVEGTADKADDSVHDIAGSTLEVGQEVTGAAPAEVATLPGSAAAATPATAPNSSVTEPVDGGVPRPSKRPRADEDAPDPASSASTPAKVPAPNSAVAEEETEAPAPPASPNLNTIDPKDDVVPRPVKRARLDGEASGQDPSVSTSTTTEPNTDAIQQPLTPEKPCPILTLPLELIAEILILTGSPQHVLATARTCKALCHTLLSPNAQFIWRETRKGSGCTFEFSVSSQAAVNTAFNGGAFMIMNGMLVNVVGGVGGVGGGAAAATAPVKETKILTLPDPPTDFFGEAAYAAFVFDSGKCENCDTETSLMYASFALRARFCKNNQCTSLLTHMHPVNGATENKLSEALPTNEAHCCFQRSNYSIDTVWPEVRQKFCRPDKMHAVRAEYEAMTIEGDYNNKFELLKERNKKWMKFCVKLYKWRKLRQEQYYSHRAANEATGKKIASRYGWEYDDLMNTSYGQYQRHKSKLIEKVDEIDVKVMQDAIESQLLALTEKRERRNTEIALMKNREDVEAVYKRLRSGKLHPYLPSLANFRQLPVISMLQSADPSSSKHSVAETLQNDKVMKELMTSQLKKWSEKAKQDMGVTLGFPKNWKSANKNVLHPVERVTARFLCVKCERVDAKYRVDKCLDFAGACVHECGVGNQKKGRVRKGKAIWDPKNFVKDEKTINVLRKSIEALGFAEDRDAGHYLLQVGLAVVCMSCEPCMVLDSRSLIGHSHRHDDMQISFTSMENIASYLGGFPYHHGLVHKLLGPGSLSNAGKKEIDRKNYGCRHCLREKQVQDASAAAATSSSTTKDAGTDTRTDTQGATAQASSSGSGDSAAPGHIELKSVVYPMHDLAIEGPLERPPPLFNFNGMRSHLKSKHKIEDIRDEDILCYRNPDIIF